MKKGRFTVLGMCVVFFVFVVSNVAVFGDQEVKSTAKDPFVEYLSRPAPTRNMFQYYDGSGSAKNKEQKPKKSAAVRTNYNSSDGSHDYVHSVGEVQYLLMDGR